MAKNESSKQSPSTKVNDSKGQVREGHNIGRNSSNTKAWQPTTDRTTTPPPAKGNGEKK
ncbi:MAG: hypothetical protein PF440_04935 [Thiomicrorhabdus sp.]|jgi:hypothetical protein|nr:hypothetical protein [Thiomicrorhabdus sp.]